MPEKKSDGRLTVAVEVSIDELTVELLRRVAEPLVADAIASATIASEKRLRSNRCNRHDCYKSKRFFRRMVEKFVIPPESLGAAVGLKGIDPRQVAIPGVDIREKNDRVPGPDDEAVQALLTDPKDEFANMLDVPQFSDYEHVFGRYPYVYWFEDGLGEKRAILGYASARDRNTDALIRRNCAFYRPNEDFSSKGTAFNDLQSVVGMLRKDKRSVRQFIKVIPAKVGSGVRFWTNVEGRGKDEEALNRYVVLTDNGLVDLPNRLRFNDYHLTKGVG